MKGKKAVITGGLILVLAIGGIFISIYVLRGAGPVPKSQGEYQSQTEKEQVVEEEPVSEISPYYLGTVSILETQMTTMCGQVKHSSIEDIVFDSEELLVYDDKTQKCYIMGRRLTFKSSLLVTNTHPYLGTLTEKGQSYGETAEKYGRGGNISEFGYFTASGIADYSAFPVRIDVAEGLIYTLIPTQEANWVEKQIGDEVFLDPPTALVQEAIASDLVEIIPEISEIDISEVIIPDILSLLPGMSVDGTFIFKFRRATMEEVRQFGTELSNEIAIRQQNGEIAPDLTP
jgi:hypothetical protein